MAANYHIAQLNVARMRAPLDDPLMADFVANLDAINALGEQTPGFVWRLIDDEGSDATAIRLFDDRTIVNMTVWDSIDALYDYAYYSGHADIYRRRLDWFEKPTEAVLVLWWIPVGHIPTLEEAKERLLHLRALGPTPQAFTFKQRFTVDEVLAAQPVKESGESA
ncbi:MAG: DUF3291 domain-containing protein [Anaerolineae bacterium]|nr:DUF3291 domain-containing protein [Anaerolineae bacterium]